MSGTMTVEERTGAAVDWPGSGLSQNLEDFMLNRDGNADPTGLNNQLGGLEPFTPQPTLEERAAQLTDPNEIQALRDEVTRLKSHIGVTENEKGVLRARTEEAATSLNEALMRQKLMADRLDAMLSQPQPQYPTQPQAAPMYGLPDQAQILRLVSELDEDGYVDSRKMKGLLDSVIGPALAASMNEARLARQELHELRSRQLDQAKRSAGITPLVEMQLLESNPWIKRLPEDAKTEALINLAPRAQAPAKVQPVQTSGNSAQLAANRALYVEPQRTSQGAPPVAETSAMDAFSAEWARTLEIPLGTGKREAAQRALLNRHGMIRGNDWR